jgi:hypothetical protein
MLKEGAGFMLSGQTTDGTVLRDVLKENLTERPLIIGYLAQLVSLRSEQRGSWGEILVDSLVTAIPSRIFPFKVYWMLGGAEEDIAAKHLGITEAEDSANTVLTTAYTEARELGLLAYAGVVCGLMVFMASIIRLTKTPLFSTLAVIYVIFQLFYLEDAFLSSFATLRSLLLFFHCDLAYRVCLKQHLAPWLLMHLSAK